MSIRFLLLPLILIIVPLWAQEYTLGPGDVVSLSVPDLKEMDGSYRVNNMGNLELPYLKTVPIRGKTVLELKTIIEARLKANYLNDPQVLVKIEEVHANPISFIGAVARPGPIKESYEIDLLQALSLVGGRTENASSRALIIRRSLSGETATLEVDLNRLLNDGLPYLNIPLFAGDTVNIPNKVDVHIYITGEVNQPGELTFSDSDKLTLLRVISKAGGFTDYARQRKIQIKRDNGPSPQEFTIDAKAIKQGKSPDFKLKADDVIIIP